MDPMMSGFYDIDEKEPRHNNHKMTPSCDLLSNRSIFGDLNSDHQINSESIKKNQSLVQSFSATPKKEEEDLQTQ